MTQDQIDAVSTATGPGHPFREAFQDIQEIIDRDGADLAGYAAQDALYVLAENWAAASQDSGVHPSEFYGDLDDVIAALQEARGSLPQP